MYQHEQIRTRGGEVMVASSPEEVLARLSELGAEIEDPDE